MEHVRISQPMDFVYHNKSKVILVISQHFVIIDLLHNYF